MTLYLYFGLTGEKNFYEFFCIDGLLIIRKKQVITITVVAMVTNLSPFCSLVCKLSKYIWLLGALLHRHTVIDFLMHSVLG